MSSEKSHPKIVLFSKHLHWLNLKQAAEIAAQVGFDGLDLTIRPDGHILPERVEDDLPKAVEICRQAGIEVTMLATTIDNTAQPFTEKILKTAGRLGISQYRMTWYYYEEAKSLRDNLLHFKSKLQDLAELNSRYEITGVYQNHDGGWFGSPVWDLAQILQKINSPWLGCQYDILNATIEGARCWHLALEMVAPYIRSIDIKDFRWEKQEGDWIIKYVPLGDGMVDFKRFFKMTNTLGIKVPLSLHLEYEELGGADKGASRLTVPAETVISALKKDFIALQKMVYSPNK